MRFKINKNVSTKIQNIILIHSQLLKQQNECQIIPFSNDTENRSDIVLENNDSLSQLVSCTSLSLSC